MYISRVLFSISLFGLASAVNVFVCGLVRERDMAI